MDRIAHELAEEIRTGRNYEDRAEWRATWDELFEKRTRGK